MGKPQPRHDAVIKWVDSYEIELSVIDLERRNKMIEEAKEFGLVHGYGDIRHRVQIRSNFDVLEIIRWLLRDGGYMPNSSHHIHPILIAPSIDLPENMKQLLAGIVKNDIIYFDDATGDVYRNHKPYATGENGNALIAELTRQDCLTPLYASTIESFSSMRVNRTPDYS